MFSGIIEHQAKILSIQDGIFCVENTFDTDLILGQSIAHDGACMTITKYEKSYYEFFVMRESLSVTNLGVKQKGDTFNVERSLKIGGSLDGHIVTGHIDTVGKVIQIEHISDGSLVLSIGFDPAYASLIIRKGSVALNGVSLTIVEDGHDFLTVSLIPLTQSWTNLGNAKIGDSINIEFDMMAKYMLKQSKMYLHQEG